jgi:hypothetical protein
MRYQETESFMSGGGLFVPQSEAMRASGPAIGPIHTGVIPPPAELRKGVPAGAVLSPLAITLRGLRKAPYNMKAVSQIVVHMTSRGPVNRSKKSGYRTPAITYALNHYLNGGEGFPHYVIDFNGTIYATCDERKIAYHSGWVHAGGAELFRKADWRAPAWWQAVWGRFGLKSPINLLPKGAAGPNARSIGIELLISPTLTYTEQQYRALARLVLDIERRHGLKIQQAPSPMLLGHEDYAPVLGKGGRSNKGGGWDPGAHRSKPFFSWSKLWSYMRGSGAAQPEAQTQEVKMSWRLAKSLDKLRKEVNIIAPQRNKASDGTIGDAAHAARTSDHNPWVKDNGMGVVTAMDITHDPASGCNANDIAETIRAFRDARVKYIIWNRRIASSTPIGRAAEWSWRPYKGSNPHTKHVHVSVKPQKGAYDSTNAWLFMIQD